MRVDGWYDVNAVEEYLRDVEYDMIIIDGPPALEEHSQKSRHGFLENVGLFDLSKPIVVDDCQRKDDMNLAIEIASLKGMECRIVKGEQEKKTGFIGLGQDEAGKIAYLIVSETGECPYDIPNGSDVYLAKWTEGDPKKENVIYMPDSSWSESRNSLYELASSRCDYLYYVYMDDDVGFVNFSLGDFEARLRETGCSLPCVVPNCRGHYLYEWIGDDTISMLYFDHPIVAVRKEIASEMPFSVEFDATNWWRSTTEWCERYRDKFGLTTVCIGSMKVDNLSHREYPRIRGLIYEQETSLPRLNILAKCQFCHFKGDMFYHTGNHKKAFELWLKGAELGSEQCIKNVSWAYNEGIGCEKDLGKYEYWRNK